MSNETQVAFTGTREQEQELRQRIAKVKETHIHDDGLMPALQAAQSIYGYLPLEVQRIVAEELDVFLENVYEVATFYSQFTLEPKGRYNVAVCMGTACYVKGAGAVLEEFVAQLGIEEGGTSEDGKFSLEATRCIGACGLAPVITVNDDVYGRLDRDDVAKVLAKYAEVE